MKRARKCEEAKKKKKKKFHCLDLAKKKKIYVSNKYEPSTSTRQCLKESAIN